MTILQLHDLRQILVMVHAVSSVGTINNMLMLTDPEWSLT